MQARRVIADAAQSRHTNRSRRHIRRSSLISLRDSGGWNRAWRALDIECPLSTVESCPLAAAHREVEFSAHSLGKGGMRCFLSPRLAELSSRPDIAAHDHPRDDRSVLGASGQGTAVPCLSGPGPSLTAIAFQPCRAPTGAATSVIWPQNNGRPDVDGAHSPKRAISDEYRPRPYSLNIRNELVRYNDVQGE